ncbi:hypothetical protein C0J52_04826 [Blattella germanica]|nr:hypothetical protein C0J52_04826 [Blattella germanica]
MGRGFVFLFTVFAILIAKDKQCDGQGVLRRIAEFENNFSNLLDTVNRRTYGMQAMLNAFGGSGSGGPTSNFRGGGPLLNVLTSINNFITNYIDPVMQIVRDVKKVFAPIRQAVYQAVLYSLRSFNEFMVKQVKKRLANRPKPLEKLQNGVKNIVDKIKNRPRFTNLLKPQKGPLARFLSPLINGALSQTLTNALSQIVLRKPTSLINTVNAALNRLFPTRELPPVLKGRIVVNVVKLIQLGIQWLLKKLRRQPPRASILLLIFLLQWRIAQALVSTIDSIKNIVGSVIRILMGLRTSIRSRISLASKRSSRLAKISTILSYFGIGGNTRSFPIATAISRSLGTVTGFIGILLSKIPGAVGSFFGVLNSLFNLAQRAYQRFIASRQQ